MKRFAILLLILLTLTGCGRDSQDTQIPPQESLAAPTEPAGSYDPDSLVEQATGGDIRAYPQNIPEIFAISCAGEDVLVFSGHGDTTITRLTGENLYRIAQRELDCSVYPATQGTKIREDGMVYYDYGVNAMVFLDENLQESQRIQLPDDLLGEPAITEDWQTVYYFTQSGLRAMDLNSGISRIIREMENSYQVVESLLMEDSLIRCSTVDAFENWHVLYIDTRTGELKADTDGTVSVRSGGDTYYSIRYDDGRETVVFGRADEAAKTLLVQTDCSSIFPDCGSLLSQTELEEGWKLDYYDLTTGLRTASVILPAEVIGWGYDRDPSHDHLYFYGYGQGEYMSLYRWDLDRSASNDEQIYTDTWHTPENPDEEGLAILRTKAEALSQRFGLDIRIWDRAVQVQPWDYDLAPEHRVPVIEEMLQTVETVFSAVPDGLISQILESMGLEQCGGPGTTAALAMLNDAVKKGGVMASSQVGGLSGAFIPVSEDAGMIAAARSGALCLEKLEAMTAVCSVGLDMIAIPGDTSAAVISGIIADEISIGVANTKTTAVRLIPAYGCKVGDTVSFGGLLGEAPIMPVRNQSPEVFLARGGHVPAPIHSLKN